MLWRKYPLPGTFSKPHRHVPPKITRGLVVLPRTPHEDYRLVPSRAWMKFASVDAQASVPVSRPSSGGQTLSNTAGMMWHRMRLEPMARWL